MKVSTLKRPWSGQSKQGKRYNPDPFYNSPEWRRVRKAFIQSSTILWNPPFEKQEDGSLMMTTQIVSNRLCHECAKQGNTVEMHTVDHIVRIKDGGSRTDFSNLQSLCKHHHAVKSAQEGNTIRA